MNNGSWTSHLAPLTLTWRETITSAIINLTLIGWVSNDIMPIRILRYLERNMTVCSLKTTSHKSQKGRIKKGMAQWKSISAHGKNSKKLLHKTESVTQDPNHTSTTLWLQVCWKNHCEQLPHTRTHMHVCTHRHTHTPEASFSLTDQFRNIMHNTIYTRGPQSRSNAWWSEGELMS